MNRTIIERDIEAGTARIRFEHQDVTVEDTFYLINVVPSTAYVFSTMGLTFDESYQDLAIDRLEAMIQNQIEAGIISNPPEVEQVEYTAPEETPEETPTNPEAE